MKILDFDPQFNPRFLPRIFPATVFFHFSLWRSLETTSIRLLR